MLGYHFMEKFLQIIEATKRQKVNISPLISRLTLDIICLSAFNINFHAQDETEFTKRYLNAINTFAVEFLWRLMNLFYHVDFFYHFTDSYRRYTAALKLLHETTETIIKNRLQARDSGKKEYIDFLEILISSTGDDGKSISFEELRAEVDTFMFEGHDTTTQGLTWTFYLLAKHPNIQEKAREEIMSVLDKSKYSSYEQLNSFTYLTAIIKESHRLYPPVPIIARLVDEPFEVAGYTIPVGTQIRIAPWGIHRNPNVWKSPDDFMPERFLEPIKENADNPFAYVPFSAGSRNCIGQKFAINEEITIISSVLRRFRLILDETHPVDFNPKFVMCPSDGIVLSFEEL